MTSDENEYRRLQWLQANSSHLVIARFGCSDAGVLDSKFVFTRSTSQAEVALVDEFTRVSSLARRELEIVARSDYLILDAPYYAWAMWLSLPDPDREIASEQDMVERLRVICDEEEGGESAIGRLVWGFEGCAFEGDAVPGPISSVPADSTYPMEYAIGALVWWFSDLPRPPPP